MSLIGTWSDVRCRADAIRFTFRYDSLHCDHAQPQATTIAPIFRPSASQTNRLIPPRTRHKQCGGPARHIGRLVRHLARLRHSHARARRLRAAKRARPYSPLSLSHVAFPLLSQSHIPSYEPRETPAFPCKCERPPATLSAPSREAIKAPHMQPFNPPSFAYVLMRGHHVHFVDTPPPPRVRRTSGCSPRPRVLLAGPNGRPIGRPAPCT